jgi:hypothetical protein
MMPFAFSGMVIISEDEDCVDANKLVCDCVFCENNISRALKQWISKFV